MKIDFLCVGFAKCGTTTLDSILRQYRQINLPIIKEPRFFHWYKKYDNPLKKLYSEYFYDVKPNQCVGIVDPAMTRVSLKEADKYFGSTTKIIIMMRNPVNALYSDFRMGLRAGYYWVYFKPFCKSSVNEKFKEFLTHCVNKQYDYKKFDLYCYDQYLEDVYKLREKENIKIIIFEEFIQNPSKIKEEIEEFLGIQSEEVNYCVWVNEGKKVCRNYICARLNNFFLQIKNNPNMNIKRIGTVGINNIQKLTLVENDEKISKELQFKCEELYRNSKNRVSELIDKDLNELWFK